MEGTRTKVCACCRARKPAEAFNTDNRSKDKLQRYCSECMLKRNQERKATRKKGIKPKALKDAIKLNRIVQEVNNGKDITEAYQSLGTTKDSESARKAAESFLSNLDKDVADDFLNQWRSQSSMMAFEEYFREAREQGTLTEKRDALTLKAKIIGIATSKHEIETKGISEQNRNNKLAGILAVINGEKEEE